MVRSLKEVKFDDKLEYEGEKWLIKQVLQQVEVNQRRIFAGIDKGVGKYENDVLVIMNEYRTDMWCKWVRDNYGEIFIFCRIKRIKVAYQWNQIEIVKVTMMLKSIWWKN